MSISKLPSLIILSAGIPHYGEQPSSLKRTNEKTRILDWQLKAVEGLCNKRILVTGYQANEFEKEVLDNVQIINNKLWDKTKSVYSFLLSLDEIESSALVTYGDILFRDSIAKNLINIDNDISIAISTFKKRNYEKSNNKFKEFVCIQDNKLSKIGNDVDPDFSSKEFIGIVYFSAKAIEFIKDKSEILINKFKYCHLSSLIEFLRSQGFGVNCKDFKSDWAEVYFKSDVAKFVFGTKAQTLLRLRSYLQDASIPEQFLIYKNDWLISQNNIIEKIKEKFKDNYLAIRSSSSSEDTMSFSNAGKYESYLNVLINDNAKKSIDLVFKSYPNIEKNPHVLVQSMVKNVTCSGVIFTRTLETFSPWLVINFDYGEDTTSITAGESSTSETLYIFKPSIDLIRNKLNDWQIKLIKAVKEIENILNYDSLDIEFAVNKSQEIIILQVRPITGVPSDIDKNDIYFERIIAKGKKQFIYLSKNPLLNGINDAPLVIGFMPDWNPAEIIGTNPNKLASSLYKYLVTDELWARQRAAFGYKDARPSKLLHLICGKPFIDVRTSLYSFIPNNLDNSLTNKILNFSLKLLSNNPQFHDKIEFKIIPTCLSPGFDKWEKRFLKENVFSLNEIAIIKSELLEITKKAFLNIDSYFEGINKLERIHIQIVKNENLSYFSKAKLLLFYCKEFGVLSFSHLARCAFIGITILNDASEMNIISTKSKSYFLSSIDSIGNKISNFTKAVKEKKISYAEFVETFGHLRPGTYDINSPRYDSNPELFLEPLINEDSKLNYQSEYLSNLWEKDFDNLLNSLKSLNLPSEKKVVENFLLKSIEGRENAKFVFTKSLSAAMEYLAKSGEEIGLTKEDCSHLELEDFEFECSCNDEASKDLKNKILNNKLNLTLARNLKISPLVKSIEDFDFYFSRPDLANFIGINSITAEIISLSIENLSEKNDFEGKIVLIKQADPGFDWIFGRKISGLITQFGGSNSHMSIRSAELGIPAAIGVGEQIYKSLTDASIIELNPSESKIKIIR